MRRRPRAAPARGLKPIAHPFMMIRLWPDHHKDPALFDELLAALKRHRPACDEVWFCTEFGFPRMEVHRRSAERLAVAMQRMRKAGFLPGLQIANTLGHSDWGLFPFEGIAWQRLVGPDGQPARMSNCPRAPELHDYLREMMQAYAAGRPSSVWIDDDLRMNNHSPVTWGCFCDRCLADFSRDADRSWTREALVAALNEPGGGRIRLAWIEFNGRSLAMVARTVAEAVHAVAPACRLSLQHAGIEWAAYNGPNWTPIFQALAGVTGGRVGSRSGAGFYADHAPRGMIEKSFFVSRNCSRLPPSVDLLCPEIENFTHNAMGKSIYGTAVESSLYLAAGCNALSYAILCSAHEPMSWYEKLLAQLASWRPFWERCLEAYAGTWPGGLETPIGREQVARRLRPGEKPFGWAAGISASRLYNLAADGLPLCTEPAAACGAVLSGWIVDGLSDEELEHRLRGGVLLDGAALLRLQERVPAKRLGVRAIRPEQMNFHERFTADPLNGGDAGRVWRLFLSIQAGANAAAIIKPLAPDARVLGEYVANTGRVVGPATVLAENAWGGRLAVFGFEGFESVISSARRRQLLEAADWISRGRLPVVIDTPAQVMAIPRLDARGRLRAVFLLNAGLDPVPSLTLRLRGAAADRWQWLTPRQPSKTVRGKRGKGEIRLTTPRLPAWSVACLAAD